MKSNPKLKTQLSKEVLKYNLTIALCVLAGFLLITALSFKSLQKVSCDVIVSKIETKAGPIARELALNNSELAAAIFDELEFELNQVGAKGKLRLDISNRAGEAVSSQAKACVGEFFSSSVYFPLNFDGTKGSISGSLSFIPFTEFITFLAIFVLVMVFLSRRFSKNLYRNLKALVINPVSKLSKGEKLELGISTPSEIVDIQSNIEALEEKLIVTLGAQAESEKNEEIIKVVEQIAHDLRSPLAALRMASKFTSELPENHRLLLQRSISRACDIASNLKNIRDEKRADKAPQNSVLMLLPLVEQVRAEKRIKADDRLLNITLEDSPELYSSFVYADAVQIKRVISNVLENAIEACDKSKKEIKITLEQRSSITNLIIQDNGKGISDSKIDSIFERGTSVDKEHGTGLGLFHAKDYLESINAKIAIESFEGLGTKVILSFPNPIKPIWFAKSIDLKEVDKICVLDDDHSIHEIWKNRFEGRSVTTFYEETSFSDFVKASSSKQTLFLVDFELKNSTVNGLQVIESLGIAEKSILVTSRFEDKEVLKECERLGLKLIPKSSAEYVPIVLSSEKTKFDAVILDDSRIVLDGWKLQAEQDNMCIRCFSDPAVFLEFLDVVSLDSKLMIDFHLKDDAKGLCGLEVAQAARELGFESVCIVSGIEPDERHAQEFKRSGVSFRQKGSEETFVL